MGYLFSVTGDTRGIQLSFIETRVGTTEESFCAFTG